MSKKAESTRLFMIDNSVEVMAYFYEYKTHLEQLQLIRKNGRGVYDKNIFEVMDHSAANELTKAAEYLIREPTALSAMTNKGLTLSRK